MTDRSLCAVVLAAGVGTRMKSARPKPIHVLCGRAMVVHVLDSLREVEVDYTVMVVGHGADRVVKTLGDSSASSGLHYVEQVTQRGTGDAVATAMTSLPVAVSDEADNADILILPGDTPLLEASTVAQLVASHRNTNAAATILTVTTESPTGYGRIVRNKWGQVRRIVEERDADEQERQIQEVNAGVYCFKTSLLGASLRRINTNNAQGELLLTDAIELLAEAGHTVETASAPDIAWAVGVNDRAQLAAAEAEMRRRINEDWMRRGVTLVDPLHTYIDMDVELESDVVIHPGTRLAGRTRVGAGAELGPSAEIIDSSIGAESKIFQSRLVGAKVGDRSTIGPYCVLGRGSLVEAGTVLPPLTRIDPTEG